MQSTLTAWVGAAPPATPSPKRRRTDSPPSAFLLNGVEVDDDDSAVEEVAPETAADREFIDDAAAADGSSSSSEEDEEIVEDLIDDDELPEDDPALYGLGAEEEVPEGDVEVPIPLSALCGTEPLSFTVKYRSELDDALGEATIVVKHPIRPGDVVQLPKVRIHISHVRFAGFAVVGGELRCVLRVPYIQAACGCGTVRVTTPRGKTVQQALTAPVKAGDCVEFPNAGFWGRMPLIGVVRVVPHNALSSVTRAAVWKAFNT
jgi:hypothetical protein